MKKRQIQKQAIKKEENERNKGYEQKALAQKRREIDL